MSLFFVVVESQTCTGQWKLSKWAFSVEVKSSELAQSCPTLCDPMDYSPPSSSVHGILQARILEWVAISFGVEICVNLARSRATFEVCCCYEHQDFSFLW